MASRAASRRRSGSSGGEAVLERGAEVGVLGPKLAQPRGLVVGQQAGAGSSAPSAGTASRAAVGSRPPGRPPASRSGRVFADRAGQPVPGARRRRPAAAARPSARHDDRLVNEARQHVADPIERDQRAGRHVARGSEAERPREDRQPLPDRPFGRGAQPVGPVDRRPQRLLARHRAAPRAGQHREVGVEALGQLGQRQRPRADGGEFERERHAVEPSADSDHVGQRRVGDRESAGRRARRGSRTARPRRPGRGRGRCSGTGSGPSRSTCSPARCSGCLLVVRIVTPSVSRSTWEANRATAAVRCSQVSRISSSRSAAEVIEDGGVGAAGIAAAQPEALGDGGRQQRRVGETGELDQAACRRRSGWRRRRRRAARAGSCRLRRDR